MGRIHLPVRDQPRGTWVGLVAVLVLTALRLLAASAFGASAAQTRHPVSYLPLVNGLPLPPYYRIAFVSSRDTNGGICVMNADGSNQTNLTNNPAADYSPVWSPDGSRIAFVSERDGNAEIYVMNAHGSNQVRLTQNPGSDTNPTWPPTIS
jgi:dipeptidyl aminopeptidase/acylaminoacyl peptidase